MLKRALSLCVAVFIFASLCTVSHADVYSDEELHELSKSVSVAARNFEESYVFDGDGIKKTDLDIVMSFVYNDNPEFFCLGPTYQYSYGFDEVTGETIAKSVIFNYRMTKEEYALAMEEVNAWLDRVVSLADPDFTEYEYALFFHDYICANYEYDTSYTVHNVYDFIKGGKGVCQAYTYAYELLMERVGIEVSWASSNAEMNHIWNVVKVDGEWYHVDLTWDDPVGNVPGTAKHTYFMLSDKGISTEEKGHFGWVSPYGCTSEKYDANAIGAVTSAFAHVDGRWFYVADGDLYVTDSPDVPGELHTKLGLLWYTWPGTDSYYLGSYSAIAARKGKLYVSTQDGVLRIDPSSGAKSSVYTYKGGEGRVYGFILDMGEDKISGADFAQAKVLVNVAVSPSAKGTLVPVQLVHVLSGGSGDVNGDGRVNLADVSLVLKLVAKWDVTLNEVEADVDGNGKVNVSDASWLLKIVAGWDVK